MRHNTRQPIRTELIITLKDIKMSSQFNSPGHVNTHLSMGVIMKGIVERPMAVVVHLRTGKGHLVVLPSRYREAAHTRLMVNPGMATDAKACHTNVSTTATATRVVFPGLSP